MALYAIGCYSPSPPPGAYRCSTADNSCPSGQHCTCGLCVNTDDQAACGFQVKVAATSVSEHQKFGLTMQALESDGKTAAASFNGVVTLASSWGDVRPTTVTLAGGKANLEVTLNRETLPPQTAIISATFAGNKGASGKITVAAQDFVRDANAIVPPATLTTPYAFADTIVAQPDLLRSGNSWHMYFGGFSGKRSSYSFGYATSSDGITFTPAVMPIFSAGDQPFDNGLIESPSAFTTCTNTTIAFEAQKMALLPTDKVAGAIGVAASSDGMATFMLENPSPVLNPTDCDYCGGGLAFPSVIKDPASPPPDGGCGGGYIMFFSATDMNNVVNIGRAESSDGVHFTAEPAPLLSGTLEGEAVLLSPRVIVDGTVFKMFYSFARLVDFKNNDLCQSNVGVGYATSSDGFYWIRSPSNPVMAGSASGWDAGVTAFLVGSIVPTDGSDPQNGLSLYYSTFRHLTVLGTDQCLPNGIGRATRP